VISSITDLPQQGFAITVYETLHTVEGDPLDMNIGGDYFLKKKLPTTPEEVQAELVDYGIKIDSIFESLIRDARNFVQKPTAATFRPYHAISVAPRPSHLPYCSVAGQLAAAVRFDAAG
jgi:hypothetical protein